jgi:hypothetical protein
MKPEMVWILKGTQETMDVDYIYMYIYILIPGIYNASFLDVNSMGRS